MSAIDPELVNRALQRLAREHHGRDTQGLQVLYAIEGFLRRLSVSRHREQLVLKGGMLLAVLDARRMTRDADLSAHGMANDEASVAAVVAEIASTEPSAPDGLDFDVQSISTEPMRDSAVYSGVRARLPAQLGAARLRVMLDVSFGDPGDVEEIRYPEILGGVGIPLKAYPIERTLAEKLATMIERGETNTRDRDFADVWVLSRLHPIDGERLAATLRTVAAQRGHALEPLAQALADMPDRQRSYETLRRRASFALDPPARWTHLLADVIAFADPLIEDPSSRWDPQACRWR